MRPGLAPVALKMTIQGQTVGPNCTSGFWPAVGA